MHPSVLDHDNPSLEHVFVDGGSTDGTVEIITKYASQYPDRVKFFSRPGTSAGEGHNAGLKLAGADIFGCMGVDDFMEKGAIETVVHFFRSNPDACFVYGHFDRIDVNGQIIEQRRVSGFNLRDFINTASHLTIISTYYRRAVMEKIGWLDNSGNDFDLIIRIAQNFQVHHVDQVLSKVMIRKDSAFSPSDP